MFKIFSSVALWFTSFLYIGFSKYSSFGFICSISASTPGYSIDLSESRINISSHLKKNTNHVLVLKLTLELSTTTGLCILQSSVVTVNSTLKQVTEVHLRSGTCYVRVSVLVDGQRIEWPLTWPPWFSPGSEFLDSIIRSSFLRLILLGIRDFRYLERFGEMRFTCEWSIKYHPTIFNFVTSLYFCVVDSDPGIRRLRSPPDLEG